MIRLKLPYFGHSIQISRAMEKDLIVGKVKGKRRGQLVAGWMDF